MLPRLMHGVPRSPCLGGSGTCCDHATTRSAGASGQWGGESRGRAFSAPPQRTWRGACALLRNRGSAANLLSQGCVAIPVVMPGAHAVEWPPGGYWFVVRDVPLGAAAGKVVPGYTIIMYVPIELCATWLGTMVLHGRPAPGWSNCNEPTRGIRRARDHYALVLHYNTVVYYSTGPGT